MEDILSSFRLTDAQEKSYDTVVEKFEAHFVKRRILIFERAKFNRRRQEEGEPVDDFIMDLYHLAEHCSYGMLHDELVRDRTVVGLRSAALSEKLQRDADLTLDKAMQMARKDETITKQQALLRSDFQDVRSKPADTHELDFVKRRPFKFRGKPRNSSSPSQQQRPNKCTRCGKYPSHGKQQCPARESKCHACGKKGHFKSMCRSHVTVKTVETTSGEKAFLGVVGESEELNPWSVTLTVNGVPVEFKIDTGADVTVIPVDILWNIPDACLREPTKTLSGANNKVLQVKGQFTATLDREATEEIYAVKRLTRSLLGRPAIEALALIKRVHAVQTETEIVKQFPKLFRGLGKLKEDYKKVLREDSKPYALTTPRRIAIPYLRKVKAKLDAWSRWE